MTLAAPARPSVRASLVACTTVSLVLKAGFWGGRERMAG